MPSHTTTFTITKRSNAKEESERDTIPSVENNLGNSKNCLICGSFVHMTRNCPVSP